MKSVYDAIAKMSIIEKHLRTSLEKIVGFKEDYSEAVKLIRHLKAAQVLVDKILKDLVDL